MSVLMDLFAGLAQATRCCRQDTAFCADVTFHQYIILDAVAKSGKLAISDLHEILAVEKSTTTRLMKPLIDKGLLVREKSNSDSRFFRLALTRKGLNTHGEVQACLTGFFNTVMGHLPEKDQDMILRSVGIFIEAIKDASGTYNCTP